MDKKEEEFQRKLLSIFRIEAKEHLDTITSGLIELEKSAPSGQMELIENIFRESHSLKGAARSVNLADVVTTCQSMENVFGALKRKELEISPRLFDALHHAIDFIGEITGKEEEITVSQRSRLKDIVQELEKFIQGPAIISGRVNRQGVPEEKHNIPEKDSQQGKIEKTGIILSQDASKEEKMSGVETGHTPLLTETIRISTAKLDSLLFKAEELLSIKLAAEQRAAELREVAAYVTVWEKQSVKIHPEKSQACIKYLENRLSVLAESAGNDYRSLSGIVDALLDDMKKALMLPFSSLLEIFPKLVRDLSRDQGKEADLVIEGGGFEIDRRVMEEMKDPLIHLIRNCIDHGIETPAERIRKKKSPRGTVRLSFAPKDGNKTEIIVSDDGVGIDATSVKSAAVKRGVISPEEAKKLGEQEALSLVFLSGVSTSPIITEVSGRGLGLAIVREKVEKLNGVVSFETQMDAGTTFRIMVPLTLATFRGLLIRLNGSMFVLPAANVETVGRIKKEEIRTVENRDTIYINKRVISLVNLADALELKHGTDKSGSDENMKVVVLGYGEKSMAFTIDDIINEQEVLVKNLGRQLLRVRNISGATVLGNGRVVPILNIHDLLKSGVTAVPSLIPAPEVKKKSKSILVVEDSITARTLLKNILESSGFEVKTAVDGVDAYSILKTSEFDLVLSDVSMPRMDGLELTSKIRSDSRLSELPVVLVTGLESSEDRERGIDVGANAYIVKSSFDQSNLLEVIQRLI